MIRQRNGLFKRGAEGVGEEGTQWGAANSLRGHGSTQPQERKSPAPPGSRSEKSYGIRANRILDYHDSNAVEESSPAVGGELELR